MSDAAERYNEASVHLDRAKAWVHARPSSLALLQLQGAALAYQRAWEAHFGQRADQRQPRRRGEAVRGAGA